MQRAVLVIDNGGHHLKALFLPAALRATERQDNPVDVSPTTSGASPPPTPQVLVIPNCIGAAAHAGSGLLGDQLDRLPHYHGLVVRRPVDRGFIVDGALQARIWEHVLEHFHITQESGVDLWLTVPFGAPKAVAQLLMLLCTRSFHFGSVTLISSSFLSLIACAEGHPRTSSMVPGETEARCVLGQKRPRSSGKEETGISSAALHTGTGLVVDVGFSATTVIPYVDHLPVLSSIVRLDVGGKLLTNRLKECLSFRQVNVMEDGWLLNYVKESCCTVALEPWQALHRYAALCQYKTRDEVEDAVTEEEEMQKEDQEHEPKKEGSLQIPEVPLRFYLPTIPALYPLGVLEHELSDRLPKSTAVDASALQHLLLCQERFLIPELLFTPGDVELPQMGLAQALTEGVFERGLLQHVRTLLRPLLLSRVCVYGGTAALPHLCQRLQSDVNCATAAATQRATEDSRGEEKETTCVVALIDMPSFLATAAAASNTSAHALRPLFGAWRLLAQQPYSPSSSSSSDVDDRVKKMPQLRALVQQRSNVELVKPGAGRVAVELFQAALQAML